ncbi:MAG TPA: NAD-dependent epimerase/dehydratase family protein [Chloroflexota bacterium]|nr:NAD-dependent epimerase/dehydratase family protein [Chloroflexota bacterium]
MRFFVTGCAGFIGSNLTDRLLADGHEVVGYDNFATGRREFLSQALSSARMRLVEGDLLESDRLAQAVAECDFVFHLAANADVRHGTEHPRRDLEQNTMATHNVLEAMRQAGVKQIAFSSTGSVYGEPEVFPTPEDAPFPLQTSLYAASKLAAEAMISAYCTGFGMQALIFRFVSILGERYTHGHVFDFYEKLLADPTQIEVLGDGQQRKSYLYVGDCVSAMLKAAERMPEQVAVYNLGTDEYCKVEDSLGWISGELGLAPRRHYSGGQRGWVGDSPFIFLDCSRIKALGWQSTLSIQEAVVRTLDYLKANQWLLAGRT